MDRSRSRARSLDGARPRVKGRAWRDVQTLLAGIERALTFSRAFSYTGHAAGRMFT